MGCVCINLACLKTESEFKCCSADVLDGIASSPLACPLLGFSVSCQCPPPDIAGASNIHQLAKKALCLCSPPVWRLILWVCNVWLLVGSNPSWCRSIHWFQGHQLSEASPKGHEHHYPHLAHQFHHCPYSFTCMLLHWVSNEKNNESKPWEMCLWGKIF